MKLASAAELRSQPTELGFESASIKYLALPDYEIPPAQARNSPFVPLIPFNGARDFRMPVLNVGFRPSPSPAIVMAMPKAPMNPDNRLVFGEDYIRFSGHFTAM